MTGPRNGGIYVSSSFGRVASSSSLVVADHLLLRIRQLCGHDTSLTAALLSGDMVM